MGEDRDATQDRVTIQEAARRLGVKEDAVRKRIQRGSIRHEKDEDGRVYVWVDTTQDTTQDATQDTTQDESLEILKDQVRYLREQLDAEREARTEERRRADTIIAQLAQSTEEQARTIRVLEAPQEASEAVETPSEPVPGIGGTPPAQETASERRPWWRRWFS